MPKRGVNGKCHNCGDPCRAHKGKEFVFCSKDECCNARRIRNRHLINPLGKCSNCGDPCLNRKILLCKKPECHAKRKHIYYRNANPRTKQTCSNCKREFEGRLARYPYCREAVCQEARDEARRERLNAYERRRSAGRARVKPMPRYIPSNADQSIVLNDFKTVAGDFALGIIQEGSAVWDWLQNKGYPDNMKLMNVKTKVVYTVRTDKNCQTLVPVE